MSSKSSYDNDFWRSCDTEDWSNDAENTAAHHRNKWPFTVYSIRKQLFQIVIIILHNITVFTAFLNKRMWQKNSGVNIQINLTNIKQK